MRVTQEGLALIKAFESCKLTAYLDVLAKPPVWTIGYGHTATAVQGMKITQAQAEALFADDVETHAVPLAALLTRAANSNQYSAMVSLAFNTGVGAFSKSTVLRMHNAGKFAEAGAAFAMWNRAGGQVRAGLTRRRAAEAALYLTPAADAVEQATRAAPDTKDPGSSTITPGAVAAGAGAALGVAQQAVAQIADVWEGVGRMGVNPHILLGLLGAASIVALGYFIWEARKRRAEGDR